MFERIRTDEHEEHLKNIVSDFLKDTWYKQTNEINTSGRADLAIHNGTTSSSSVGVLIEVKRPTNRNEMISPERPNPTRHRHPIIKRVRKILAAKNVGANGVRPPFPDNDDIGGDADKGGS
jgi:hypothetical protein